MPRLRGHAAMAFLAALLLAPAVAADLQLDLHADVDTVRPGVTSANVTVTASLDCAQVLARTGAGNTANGVTVTVSRSGDATVTWSGAATLLVPVEPCLTPTNARSSVTSLYTAGLEGKLPALVPQSATVAAAIPAGPPGVSPAENVTKAFTLQAVPVPAVTASTPVQFVRLTGPTGLVPIAFRNLGNVAVTLDSKTEARVNGTGASGTLTLPPVELAIDATQEVQATFQAPAGEWAQQTILLEVTPVAKGTGQRGVPVRIEFLFQAPPAAEKSPAPAVAWMAPVLLAAAALAPRRKV